MMFTLRRGMGLIITAGHGHIKGLRKRANTLLKYHRQHAYKPLSNGMKHKRQTPAPPLINTNVGIIRIDSQKKRAQRCSLGFHYFQTELAASQDTGCDLLCNRTYQIM